jgi:hypothetical protein
MLVCGLRRAGDRINESGVGDKPRATRVIWRKSANRRFPHRASFSIEEVEAAPCLTAGD